MLYAIKPHYVLSGLDLTADNAKLSGTVLQLSRDMKRHHLQSLRVQGSIQPSFCLLETILGRNTK